jgi:hypothetical protein
MNKYRFSNEIIIELPDGYEVDVCNSKDDNIVIKRINELPKKWEDIGDIKGYYITSNSEISDIIITSTYNNKNIYPTKELAEASLALIQLLYLRDIYNDGWSYDWNNTIYVIVNMNNTAHCIRTSNISSPMMFKSAELRDKFYNNFIDLLEIAKPLL